MYINVHALDLSVQFYSSSSMCMSCTSTCTRRVRRPAPLHSHSRGLLRVSNSVCVFSFFAGWREQGSGWERGSGAAEFRLARLASVPTRVISPSYAVLPSAALPPRPHVSALSLVLLLLACRPDLTCLHRTFHPLFLFLSRSASPETRLTLFDIPIILNQNSRQTFLF